MTHPLIITAVRNQIGHIWLDRPTAYNAINLDSVRQLMAQLQQWEADDHIRAVVLRASGDKAFCAGGDIRELYDSHLQGTARKMQFFEEQYVLDQYIRAYRKPFIALAEGLVLGGGMGLFQGAAFRVITEKARLGMPETSIGYFPDVGGSYFLSRLAGALGNYLAVSGSIINADDGLYANLADYSVPAEKVAELDEQLDRLAWQEPAADCVRQLLEGLHVAPAAPGALEQARADIDLHFAHANMADIQQSLAGGTDWAQETLDLLRSRSPIAMVTALAMQERGRTLTMADCFAMELHVIAHWFDQGDFIEGVRALIVDKDKNPRWKYGTIEQVPKAAISAMLAGF